MLESLQLAENVRHRFCAPVQLQWTNSDGKLAEATGTSVDASVYGLGLLFPQPIPVGTEVTVVLGGVTICGSANVRHSDRHGADYQIGLRFRQALFMQKVPELDKVLIDSFYANSKMKQSVGHSLLQQLKVLLARALFRKD